MNWRLKLAIFVVLGGVLAFFTPFASAHFLQISGSVSTVLHIDPDDDPIIGQPATLSLTFIEGHKDFRLNDCTCTVQISGPKNASFSEQLSGAENFKYTFNNVGTYTIKIDGAPKADGTFQNFEATYQIEADRTSAATPAENAHHNGLYHTLWMTIGFLSAFPTAYLLDYFGKNTLKRKNKDHIDAQKE